MRRIAALGTSLVIGGALIAGAAPAGAQEIECGTLISPFCAAAGRVIQDVEEELGHVPEYVQHAYDTAYALYDTADRTVRCVVFKECS